MKPAVLFDLDGTLWDSTPQITASWDLALAPHGICLTLEQVRGIMGKTADEIAAVLFPNASPRRQKELFDACSAAELAYLGTHSGTVYPRLEETLRALSGEYTLGIVSNCQEGYIETFLACTGLGSYFSDLECAGRTGLSKGENIRLVLERGGLAPAVYVGDTQSDLAAANAAGVPFIHAAYGFGRVDPALPAIHAPAELPALVRALI